MKTFPTTISFQSNLGTPDLVFPVAPPADRALSRFKLFSPKWCGCLIALFTIIFVSKSFGQDCSAGVDITLTCVDGITPSTSALLATPIGGTWSNATDNPTVATFMPNAATTFAGNLEAGVYRFIYTTTVPTACSDTVQVTIPDCQSLCLPVEVSDTLVCVGSVLDLTGLVAGFDTLLNVSFEVDGLPVTNASAFAVDSAVTIQVTASTALGCSNTKPLVITVSDCGSAIDLSLNKSISRKLAMLGDTLTYTILVANDGPDLATGITVTDSLNAGVQYLSSATAMGSYDPNTKVWTVDSLNAGDTVSLSITVRVVAQGVWFNTAEISGVNQNDIDSSPGNGAEGEDDIDRQCFTVPYLICQGQGTVLELNVPGQYTGVVWFRQMQGGQQEQVGTGNTYEVSETELGSYEYTFTSTSGSCPAEGCCPVIVVVEDCCPANLCVPFVITKKVK